MEIELLNIAKRYRFEWIFRQLDFTFQSNHRYAVLGPNGTGKSTFLKILSGHLTPSKGTINFKQNGQVLDISEVYQYVSYAAPYIDLIEEFTLREAIDFHQKFKPLKAQLDTTQLIDLLGLQSSTEKEIRFFSSGMKQRLKLALAICGDSPLVLLDEPSTNLDQQGMDWYQQLLQDYATDRLLVIASNVPADYEQCDASINITDYKKKR